MTEPSNAELAARVQDLKTDNRSYFDRLEIALSKAVNNDVYTLQVSELSKNIGNLANALDAERRERKQDKKDSDKAISEMIKAQKDFQEETARKRAATLRWVVATVLLPVALFAAQLYAAFKGVS